MSQATLPIDDALPAIRAALAKDNRLVLAAPPGAGKTTRLPLDLLGQAWLGDRRIIMLEPRRIAARLASERMASVLGERVGATIGLSTRIDKRVSKATRIEVVTDGLFTRRLLSDPELGGVGAVLFDEFHERSLSADLGLALARDAQDALRDDLRLVLMSATLDTTKTATAFDAPVIESAGRMFPVETVYLGGSDDRIEDRMASAIQRALREQAGSILAFLPGQGEILRTAERLDNLPNNIAVAPLYGALSPRDQDAAVRVASKGERKIVLATDIAESSLTIEGVTIVIDSGLARVPDYDPGGSQRLVTRRASVANVDQRRGRAGRTAPGVCYRLWDEAQTRGLPPSPTPEILAADLSGVALALAEWGERDAENLHWIDPPPRGRMAAAKDQLIALGAIDDFGSLTAKGAAMAKLPLSPRYAALVASSETPGEKSLSARVAALASERGVGGASPDLADRLVAFDRDTSPRAKALREQAKRWGGSAAPAKAVGPLIAKAWPDRIARTRLGARGAYVMAGGQAARLPEHAALAKSEWIVVLETAGGSTDPRITLAAAITGAEALEARPPEVRREATFDPKAGRFFGREFKAIGAIALDQGHPRAPDPETARKALIDVIKKEGFATVGAVHDVAQLVGRVALLRSWFGDDWPEWSDANLRRTLEHWAPTMRGDEGSPRPPSPRDFVDALVAELGWPKGDDLRKLAPETLPLPSGRKAPIDYADDNAPLVEARAQELFGLTQHPTIAGGRGPVTLSILSPARRQVALTKDLPGFWTGGYADMAKDMRGRYPKHHWPEDPANTPAHEGRTKARL